MLARTVISVGRVAFFVGWAFVFSPVVWGADAPSPERQQARQILDAAGVRGGLIVHLGCGDGKLTAALGSSGRYLVQGLDADADDVERARRHVRSLGLYGKVSVDRLPGKRLPYVDNLVNLVVAEDLAGIAEDEVMRVLCPDGVAYVKQGNAWTKTVKPRPAQIDEWTHFLHGPDNNAVAQDTLVGPPHHMQWVGGPKFARSHEHLASISAVVTSGGRVFYIADEGPAASVDLPSRWMLIARDAFNGVVLWKRPVPRWEWRHRPFRSGASQLPRRLVAVGDRVYTTLGYGSPLTSLDAATGDLVRTYEGSAGTEEILLDDGSLFLVVGDPADQQAVDAAIRRGETPPPVVKSIVAVEADSGDLLWRKSDADTAELMPLTLAVGGGRAFFHTAGELVALDAESGAELWRAGRPISLARPAWSTPTVVVHGDVVLCADREAPAEVPEEPRPRTVRWEVSLGGGNAPPGELIAYSAETGQRLWSCKCREGYNSPVDVFVADGLLWTGDLVRARDPGITQARDPMTGEVKRTRPNDQEFFTAGMSHHRCYRNKATSRYLLVGRAGVEMIDLASGRALAHHWVRGTCQYGVVPANGLLYAPSHTCACFIQAKLNGFNALAPANVRDRESKHESQQPPPLQRGPAFQSLPTPHSQLPTPSDWPTYRHDPARSSSTKTVVSTDLQRAWQAELGGRLSSVVVAEGKLFVAQVDAHTVHALDAAEGKPLWSYTTGGRVDSPPTAHRGTVLFGSADGWVYCLRAADGQLVWRFRAAPDPRRVVAYGQLESAWPVSGSVLVEEGVAYFAAGRSTFLDDGIFLYGLDARTGEQRMMSRLCGRDPETGEQPRSAVQGFGMKGVLPDVLSSDGTFLYMRHAKFDRQGVEQEEPGRHLFTPTGFVDDSWWHRTYQLYGTEFIAGWGGWWKNGNRAPSGRLLVFDDASIYGFGRSFYPAGNAGQWRTGEHYRLFATSKELDLIDEPAPKRRRGQPPVVKSLVKCRWSERADLEARAMVLADQTLFMAGPLGETRRSQDAFEGREGIRLRAVSTADGATLAEYPLDALPVFDGMAAAGGRLFLATRDGRVLCFGGP